MIRLDAKECCTPNGMQLLQRIANLFSAGLLIRHRYPTYLNRNR